MAWFNKKADPISERSRALNDEIAALESKIKRFEAQIGETPPGPRVKSTALPRQTKPDAPTTRSEPVFEKVDTNRLMRPSEEPASTPDHFNEFGARKYDLPALLRRVREIFRGPSTNNPKLVSYLAAGGIQGMRPLRREKRIARNRTIALAVILLLILLGMIAVLHGR